MCSIPAVANESRLKLLISESLDYAKTKVDYADFLYEKLSKIEANRFEGQEISTPYSSKSRVQLRLLKNGKKVEMKIGILSEEALKKGINNGVKFLEIAEKGETEVKLAKIPNIEKHRYGRAPEFDIRKINTKEILNVIITGVENLAEKVEKENREKNVKITLEIWTFSQIEEKIIADTEGLWKTQVLPRTFLQVLTKTRDNAGHFSQTRIRIAGVQGSERLLEKKNGKYKLKNEIKERIKAWIQKSVELLEAKTINDQEAKSLDYVILHFSALGVFIHEALGHNFEADSIKSGTSGIIDREGNPRGVVASELVNIIDGPLVDDEMSPVYDIGFGTEYIDDEGVECKPKLLAEKGHVKDFILNRETAAYYSREPNGGAWSELGDSRVCRMTNTYLYPASKDKWYPTLEDLIKNVKKGVILMGTLGGAVSKEGMTSNVQIGYLVENGKITVPIRASNFTAKTMYALRYVDGFAGKLRIDTAGFCGKRGQTRYVGDGGPEWTRIKNNEYMSLVVQ